MWKLCNSIAKHTVVFVKSFFNSFPFQPVEVLYIARYFDVLTDYQLYSKYHIMKTKQ